MITLYGLAISNYFNKVKLALLFKELEFTEVAVVPSQDSDMLKCSPMGKIPYIEIDGQFITESNAIIEYLEQAYPDKNNLFPKDLLQAARCREVTNYIDMYIDSQARRLLPAAFFGAPKVVETIDEVEANLKKSVTALQKIITFKPFINSDKLTAADFSAITTLTLTTSVMTTLGRDDPLAGIDGLSNYYQMMLSLDIVKTIEEARIKSVNVLMNRNK